MCKPQVLSSFDKSAELLRFCHCCGVLAVLRLVMTMCICLKKSIKTEKFYQKISDFTSFLKKIGVFKGFFKDLRLFMTTPPTCVLQGKIILPRRSFLSVIRFQIWGEWGRLSLFGVYRQSFTQFGTTTTRRRKGLHEIYKATCFRLGKFPRG